MSKYPSNWSSIRKAIFKRDDHQCLICGEVEQLVVHHIRPISMYGNHEIYNLITVCSDCHIKEHNSISTYGLVFIPGPYFEPYRFYLTDTTSALKLSDHLIKMGIDQSVLISRYEGNYIIDEEDTNGQAPND